MLLNMLPEDTRIAEMCASISLIIISLLFSFDIVNNIPFILNNIQVSEFWIVILSIFGILQLISIIFYNQLEFLRSLCSIAVGCFLIWISLGSFSWDVQIGYITTFILGLANLYAFVINSVQIGYKWAK